jgi:hypothetical protein
MDLPSIQKQLVSHPPVFFGKSRKGVSSYGTVMIDTLGKSLNIRRL